MKTAFSSRILTLGTACVAACALTMAPAVVPAALVPVVLAPASAAPGAQSAWDRNTPTSPSGFTVDPLPTVQIDGIALAVAAKNGRGYAGGEFANARPAGAAPGTQQTPRANLLSFNLATGVLDTNFRADTDGPVRDLAVTDDGRYLLIAGNFTRVNDQPRSGFAVLDAKTGAVSAIDAQLAGSALSVATHGSTAYVGGGFSSAQGQARGGIAAIDLNTGAVLPFNVDIPNRAVFTMVVSPDGRYLVAGGQFSAIGSQSSGGVVRIDARTGALLPTPISDVLQTGGASSGVFGLSADARGFYVAGWKYNVYRGFEGVASADWDGNLRWIADCHGDAVDVWASGDEVHAVGHPHSCATISGYPENQPERYDAMISFTNSVQGTTSATPWSTSYVNYGGRPAPRITAHTPHVARGPSSGNSIRSIDGEGDYMVIGGEFPQVQFAPQQGIARFARRGVAPGKKGPEYQELGLRVVPAGPGKVQVLVTPTWDRDDDTLTYRLTRGGGLVDERRIASGRWARADYAVIDRVPAGSVTYTITVTDRDGNSAVQQASAYVGSATAPSEYAALVEADGAHQLWSSTTGRRANAESVSGLSDEGALTLNGGARKTTGILGDAISLGASGAMAWSGEKVPERYDVTVEAWVKAAPGSRNGRIIGLSAQPTAKDANNDRLLYLDSGGRVRFGTWTQKKSTIIASPAPITDGKWHHVVGTLDAVGTHRLYVDGREVESTTGATTGLSSGGYWRVGADNMDLWADADSQAAGVVVDAPAVYHRTLKAAEVARHHEVGVREGLENGGFESIGGVAQAWFTDALGMALKDHLTIEDPGAQELFAGDWDGDGIDDVGYRVGNVFHLVNRRTGQEIVFGYGRAGDDVYVGDWDGDGVDTVAVRRGNSFYVRNAFAGGVADEVLTFGRATDTVMVGDWDGNGTETLGVRRGNVYYILNSFRSGYADEEMRFGRENDVSFVGDWDGDGRDSIALRRGNVVYASDDFAGGNAPTEFVFGRSDDAVFIGDWTGTGVDGMMLGRGETYYVANRLRSGVADRTFNFPTPDPATGGLLVGRWGGDRSESLALYLRP